MFEKAKEKAKAAKNWVVGHKREILSGTLAVAVGVGAAIALSTVVLPVDGVVLTVPVVSTVAVVVTGAV